MAWLWGCTIQTTQLLPSLTHLSSTHSKEDNLFTLAQKTLYWRSTTAGSKTYSKKFTINNIRVNSKRRECGTSTDSLTIWWPMLWSQMEASSGLVRITMETSNRILLLRVMGLLVWWQVFYCHLMEVLRQKPLTAPLPDTTESGKRATRPQLILLLLSLPGQEVSFTERNLTTMVLLPIFVKLLRNQSFRQLKMVLWPKT